MKKGKIKYTIWFAFIAIVLSGCSLFENLLPDSYKFNSYVNKGIEATNAKDYKTAKDMFLKALKINENDPLVNNNIGVIYSLTGNYEKAFFHLQKALEKDPSNIYYLLNLGVAYDRAKRYGLAIEKYDKILKIKPDWIPAVNNKAYSLVNIKKIKEAVELYKKVLDKDPTNIIALAGISGLYARMGEYDKSLKWLDKAIAVKELPELYLAKGTIYEFKNDFDKAKKYLEYSYELNPNFSLTLFLLGDLYVRLGEIKKGYQFFKKAAELSEKEPANTEEYIGGNYFVLAGISESITGEKTTKQYYEKAYALFPQLRKVNKPIDVESILALAILLKNSIKLDKAEKKVKEILKIEPDNETANGLLGDIYFLKAEYGDLTERQKFYNLAIKYYQKSLDINPEQPDIYVKLGDIYFSQGNLEVIYYRQGKYHQALTEYKKALKLDPNNPLTHLSLSLLYSAKAEYAASDTKATSPVEQYSKAITELTLARSLSEDNYLFDYMIAYLYTKIGGKNNLDKAEYFAKKALENSPHCTDCLYLLSNITYKKGYKDKAYALLTKAKIHSAQENSMDIINYLKMLNSYHLKKHTKKEKTIKDFVKKSKEQNKKENTNKSSKNKTKKEESVESNNTYPNVTSKTTKDNYPKQITDNTTTEDIRSKEGEK